MAANGDTGRLVKKEEVLNDLSKVYREGLYCDINIVFTYDNSRMSTNKFMLACRIPYFATLLSSNLTDHSSDLSLSVCSSDIFKKVLDFVWEGEVLLSDLSLSTLLDLLEAARFFCIDLLVDGVEKHIKHQVQSKKVDFSSSLVALEFSTSHNFPEISKTILNFVHQNLERVSALPEFKNVSTTSVLALLAMKKGRVSSEILVLKALLIWLESNKDVSLVTREEIANSFDLAKFADKDLEIVKNSNLFDDRKLFNLMHSRLLELGRTWTKLTRDHDEGEGSSTYTSVWKMNSSRLISSIEFRLDENKKYTYDVEYSVDGEDWFVITCKDELTTGHQVVSFDRTKLQYLRIGLVEEDGGDGIVRDELIGVYAGFL